MNQNFVTSEQVSGLGDSEQTNISSKPAGTPLLPLLDREQEVLQVLMEHPLVREPLARLRNELPEGLSYHNLSHTMDVLSWVVPLALKDGLDENDTTLLAIAAAWHDTGFIIQSTANEPIAAEFARSAMEASGRFSAEEIRDVEIAILDTRIQFDAEIRTLVQRSTGRLSPWLLDSDLSNFGRGDFLRRSVEVYREMSGKDVTDPGDLNDAGGIKFVASTIRMIANHAWHSAAGREFFEVQKTVNLSKLGVLLAQYIGGTELGMRRAWDALY